LLPRSAHWLLLLPLLLVPGRSEADPKSTPWEKFDEEDGISVYRRDIEGSPLVALKGEGVVNASILKVASVIVDQKRAPEWIDSLTETKIVRKISKTEYVEWDHIATPFVLADRDFVFKTKLTLDPAKKKVLLNYHSVTDSAAPKTDYIRGVFVYGNFVLTSRDHGKKTHVSAEVLCDPKGSVAKWIVNLFQKSWPHNTIQSLRTQVAKPDIKDHPELKQKLTDEGYFK
jgi:hypothetical protein